MSLFDDAMAEVEEAERAVLPRFECGVYTRKVVWDAPIAARFVSEGESLPSQVSWHYEQIEPTPWWRFVGGERTPTERTESDG